MSALHVSSMGRLATPLVTCVLQVSRQWGHHGIPRAGQGCWRLLVCRGLTNHCHTDTAMPGTHSALCVRGLHRFDRSSCGTGQGKQCATRSMHTSPHIHGRQDNLPETSAVGWLSSTGSGYSAAGLFSAVSRQGAAGLDSEESGRLISSNKVEVNGVQIHYQKVGNGKNVILLLPGALGSSVTDFTPQLDGINKDMFTVIAWDPRGYGKSIPPTRDWPLHFFERDAEDAAKLMQTIMADVKNLGAKKYSLLGWSDGGITAMIVAARYPNLVKKLVVWGANAFVTKEETEGYNLLRDTRNWSPRMKQPMVKLYGEEYFNTQWGLWIDAISRYLPERDGDICKEEVENITCPTLILHGKKDAVVPDFHPQYLLKHIKNSRLHEFPNGKHNIHLKYSREFNSIVENFLLEM